MIEMLITAEDIAWAMNRTALLPVLANSVTEGRGTLVGYLGEAMVLRALPSARLTDQYSHDMVLDEMKIEVKSYRCSSTPKPEYSAGVFNTSMHQQPDFYVFTRILNDLSRGWICGCVSQRHFMDESAFKRRGERDGQMLCQADIYLLPFHRLIEARFLPIYPWRPQFLTE